ncbi:arylesterase [Lysobacter auxotrophicus]|uniref:GDSL-type esterase/lipase family protein n=1 Tax=Lysobacter auxotrophicus TaxID=2992573 RepID=A0ABM8DHW6_9GAMM|nr:arylesterase [Lysobacter auxotrophicus]BDU18229.1 GDSL-type esterase/lipase family protein [Lysobacter auxotrophicus]
MFFKKTTARGSGTAHRGYARLAHRLQCAIGWVAAASLMLAVAFPAFAQSAKAAPAAQPARAVLVMGDSLSAGYGLAASQGWVALTADRIAKTKPGWRVVNASISGETTAGGASRIEGELKRNKPAVVVIELGANDGLRGLPLAQSRANLDRMIVASKNSGAKVLLIGMRMPPNLGREYTQAFSDNYTALAKQHGVALLPFLLEPIATDRTAFQDDNLHPVASAQPKLRDHVWTQLAPLLR